MKGLRILDGKLVKPERSLDLGEFLRLRLEHSEPHEAALAAAHRRVLQRYGALLLPPAVLVMSAVNDHWRLPLLSGPLRSSVARTSSRRSSPWPAPSWLAPPATRVTRCVWLGLKITRIGHGEPGGHAVGEAGCRRHRAELEFPGDDAEHVGGDPGMERNPTAGRWHDLIGEEAPHRGEQFPPRRPPVRRRRGAGGGPGSGGPARTLPSRRSPWTSPGPRCGGWLAASSCKARSNTGLYSSNVSSVARRSATGSVPGKSAGASSECRPAANSASWPTSTRRAWVYSPSRRILRAIVSPGTRRMTMPAVPRPAPSETIISSGTQSPSAAARLMARASLSIAPGSPCRPGGSRLSTSSVLEPSGPTASKAQISREAPPDIGASPSMLAGPSHGFSVLASSSLSTGTSAISSRLRPSGRAGACSRTCIRRLGASGSPRRLL